jgi:hypothetical protein
MAASNRTVNFGRPTTRRSFLRTAGGCACAALTCRLATTAKAAPRYFEGCFITSDGYREYRSQRAGAYHVSDGLFARNRHFRTTGDSSMDRDLDRALGIIADLLGVNPAFGFYDPARFQSGVSEGNIMNAFATHENTDIPGTSGTVAFGWDLFQKEFYQHDNSGTSIMAIAAHEFAHILQGQRGYLSDIRTGYPLKSEINADFLAGYFLGVRKRRVPSLRFQKAGDLFIRLGNSANRDPRRTHGNSTERLNSAEAGFRVAYVKNGSLDDAVRAGLEYVEG